MTIKEALTEIRSQKGWYKIMDDEGNLKYHTDLINTAQRIEDNRCKPETVKAFFERFGYRVIQPEIIIESI